MRIATYSSMRWIELDYSIQWYEYCSNLEMERIEELLDLSAFEVEEIVGRYAAHSSRAGKLRGLILKRHDGSVELHKSFGRGKLYEKP